jgi:broad specificity phosphatase PhoE
MPTRVLLLRHAESANPHVFHGAESDVGLSERGLKQAAALAPVITARSPDRVISSAMLRARLTAEPIAQACGLPLEIEPELHERRVGPQSGQPNNSPDGIWPDTLAHWMAGDTGYALPGAESYDDLRRRVLPVWQRLTADADGRTLAIICHGVICRVLLFSLLPGLTLRDWHRFGPIRNAGISELVGTDGKWEAPRINEVPDALAGI